MTQTNISDSNNDAKRWKVASKIMNGIIRYVIIDADSGKVWDSAQGAGFKSYDTAVRYGENSFKASKGYVFIDDTPKSAMLF